MTAPSNHDRTYRIWRALSEAWDAHDPMPTVRELVEACSISSTSVVKHHLRKLEKHGKIRVDLRKARCIWVDVPYHEGGLE